MSDVRLFLVRHAESEGNAAKVMQGAGDYPLSAAGRTQAGRADALRRLSPDLVVASDLGRAIDTARICFGRVDRIDPRLRERAAGRWEGRPRAELDAAHPGALDNDDLRPDGFEAAGDVVARMYAAAAELLDQGGVVVAVTHGAALRLFDRHLGGSGRRFAHLDALVLGPRFVPLGPRFVPLGRKRFLETEEDDGSNAGAAAPRPVDVERGEPFHRMG